MAKKKKEIKKKSNKGRKERTRPWNHKELTREINSIFISLENRRNNGASVTLKSL